jgi:hypothetical protein
VLVRVGDGEFRRGDGRLPDGWLRHLDLDLLAAPELVALPARPAVDEDAAGFEQSLGCGA